MPPQKIELSELVNRAANLFRIKGYHATSISDIANSCGLSKASIYHHLPSKQALGVTAIQNLHQHFKQSIFHHANDTQHAMTDRLKNFTQAIESFYADHEGGCLVANMSHEVMGQVPEFAEPIQAYFNDWRDSFTTLLKAEFAEDKAKQLSEQWLERLQGALLMGRVFDTAEPLHHVCQSFRELLTQNTEKTARVSMPAAVAEPA